MLDDLRIKEFTKTEAKLLNPLQLALIGDGVFEIFIRNGLASNLPLFGTYDSIILVGKKSWYVIYSEIIISITFNLLLIPPATPEFIIA